MDMVNSIHQFPDILKPPVDTSKTDIGNRIQSLQVFHDDFTELRSFDFTGLALHEIGCNLIGQHAHLFMADPRMSTRRVQPLDELILDEILITPIAFLHLNGQIDRLKCGKAAQTLQTFAPTPNRIGLCRVTRIGYLGFFMAAKGTTHTLQTYKNSSNKLEVYDFTHFAAFLHI